MEKANRKVTFEEEADLYEKEALAEIKKQHFDGTEEMGEPYSTLQMGRRVIYRAKQELASRVEVVHGKWEEIGAAEYKCSRCGFMFTSGDPISMFQYCRCGAKMGSDGSAAGGRRSDQSEWQRSADDDAACRQGIYRAPQQGLEEIRMYRSPIEIIYGQMETQMEGDILRAVQKYGINVDKEELIRAMQYDRDQYNKGYADGKKDAMDELVRCKDCKHFIQEEHGCNHFGYYSHTPWVDEVDFCSYGEKRDGDGNG